MSAKIIAVVNQKGGSGKTTVSFNLAAGFHTLGQKVLLVDADPQGSSVKTAMKAPDEHPYRPAVISLAATGGRIHRMLAAHIENYDIIIIDGPPSHTAPQTRAAVAMSDLTLIPFVPSPLDLDSTVETCVIIHDIHDEQGRDTPTFLVVNQLEQTTIAKVMLQDVEEKTGFPLLNARISKRAVFKESALLGIPVRELDNLAARLEMTEVLDEILGLLNPKNFSAEIA